MATLSGYSRDEILHDLRENVVEVTFTKNNGDTRHMVCTLMNKFLPPMPPDGQRHLDEKSRSYPELVVAWDVQNNGWRSFHIDSVVPGSVQTVPGYD